MYKVLFLVCSGNSDGGIHQVITDFGTRELAEAAIANYNLEMPKTWGREYGAVRLYQC